jgi:MFS family permease
MWGVLQLATGWLSDSLGRKPFVVIGMTLQAVAIALVAAVGTFGWWVAAVVLLGIGTALVYPVLLAAVSDAVHPAERSTALGVYRFWRDSGAIAGALLSGVLADVFGLHTAILTVAALTMGSAITATRMMNGRQHLAVAEGPTNGSHPLRS